jgi:hypothetical protein
MAVEERGVGRNANLIKPIQSIRGQVFEPGRLYDVRLDLWPEREEAIA